MIRSGSTVFRVRSEGVAQLVFEHVLWPSGTVLSDVLVKYPSAGYGGSVLSISQGSNLAAAIIYSGQSETGYELFSLTPKLQHIGSLPYIYGESDLSSMQFSDNESFAAIAIERPMWWIDPGDDDPDWDTPSLGGVVHWASLYIHRIGARHPARHSLTVDMPSGWIPDGEETWPRNLQFENENSISLTLPWGNRFTFEIPFEDRPVAVPPPSG